MKQKIKILVSVIGMMILMSPLALGQGAQKIYFVTEIGCEVYYDVPDLAIIIAECDTASREESINLLADYADAFGIEPDIDAFTILVPREKADKDQLKEKGDTDHLKAAYVLNDENGKTVDFKFNWEGAGWTELDPEQDPKVQEDALENAIDMSFLLREDTFKAQTPSISAGS